MPKSTPPFLLRLLGSKALMGVLAPLVAVFLAFVVSGLIILVFITTYSLSDRDLQRLAEVGLPAELTAELGVMSDQVFPRREAFLDRVTEILGAEAAGVHGERLAETALTRENPIHVYGQIFKAALKDRNGWGNVLYRATPLIFTGLAVALAFQCGLFNIGGEGQMVMGGFALTWVGFTFAGLPWFIHLPLCILAAVLMGGLWGGIAGWLKASRGVHEVVTTIMLNWIAVALIQYLTMAYKPPESWIPHTYEVAKSAQLSRLWVYLNPLGIAFPKSNLLNTCVFIAMVVVVLVWFLLKKTKIGYEIRAVGHNPSAAECAGISVPRNTILAMALAGGLAGLVGVNQVLGYKHRFRYGVMEGLGFDGIGVAFIGRNSPFGVVLAALLFGILDQGGLAIDVSTHVPREIVMVLKATILIFVVLGTELTKRLLRRLQKREEARA
ncbi:MAG: ABC transporter permease [Desulfosarcinaceae bacterium]|nr:ABC transporter permease [Desulfosarcinaceae bacterium]